MPVMETSLYMVPIRVLRASEYTTISPTFSQYIISVATGFPAAAVSNLVIRKYNIRRADKRAFRNDFGPSTSYSVQGLEAPRVYAEIDGYIVAELAPDQVERLEEVAGYQVSRKVTSAVIVYAGKPTPYKPPRNLRYTNAAMLDPNRNPRMDSPVGPAFTMVGGKIHVRMCIAPGECYYPPLLSPVGHKTRHPGWPEWEYRVPVAPVENTDAYARAIINIISGRDARFSASGHRGANVSSY